MSDDLSKEAIDKLKKPLFEFKIIKVYIMFQRTLNGLVYTASLGIINR